MESQTCAATPHELAEGKRKCWHLTCDRTARLELLGWRWCLWHWFKMEWRQCETWESKRSALRHTHVIRENMFKR